MVQFSDVMSGTQGSRKVRTTVQPGGRIEVLTPDLPVGQPVEVTIFSLQAVPPKKAAREILARAPGRRLFKTAIEVDEYIRAERDAWDR
jgi:hypothetical protein